MGSGVTLLISWQEGEQLLMPVIVLMKTVFLKLRDEEIQQTKLHGYFNVKLHREFVGWF